MQEKKINPWLSMWTQPRKTIRAIINTNPKMGFFFLSAVWFLQLFFLFETYYSIEFPTHWIITIIIAIILSPFIGALCFYIVGWLLYVIGRALNGRASQLHNRCAFAWSRIPLIIDLVMWFALSAFIAEIIFARVGISISFIFINLITSITSIWSFVLLAGAIKEIQKFSIIKAIINVIIVYLIISIIIFALSLPLYQIIFN